MTDGDAKQECDAHLHDANRHSGKYLALAVAIRPKDRHGSVPVGKAALHAVADPLLNSSRA